MQESKILYAVIAGFLLLAAAILVAGYLNYRTKEDEIASRETFPLSEK